MQPILSSGVILGQIPFIPIQPQKSSSSLDTVKGSDSYYNSSSNDLTDLTRFNVTNTNDTKSDDTGNTGNTGNSNSGQYWPCCNHKFR